MTHPSNPNSHENHLVLLGDSIFDNGRYVPGEERVFEQVREAFDDRWQVSCLAVDGHLCSDVVGQIDRLPEDATHVIVSAGGNDALESIGMLDREQGKPLDVLRDLSHIEATFRTNYRSMLEQIVASGSAIAVCTIYDQVPLPDAALRQLVIVLLSIFNDSIVREASRMRLPVLDLREVCQDTDDFSKVSPIEPSCVGGLKIAYAIARLFRDHEFRSGRTAMYS